jgi:hypothetical protein
MSSCSAARMTRASTVFAPTPSALDYFTRLELSAGDVAAAE